MNLVHRPLTLGESFINLPPLIVVTCGILIFAVIILGLTGYVKEVVSCVYMVSANMTLNFQLIKYQEILHVGLLKSSRFQYAGRRKDIVKAREALESRSVYLSNKVTLSMIMLFRYAGI